MTIKLFKLSTGEELIVKIISEDRDSYTVKNPTIIQLQRDPSGKGGFGIGFIPFMGYCDDEINIKRDAVIVTGPPSLALEKEFIRATSGIEIISSL